MEKGNNKLVSEYFVLILNINMFKLMIKIKVENSNKMYLLFICFSKCKSNQKVISKIYQQKIF